MGHLFQLLIDTIPTPIGTLQIAADLEGNLRVVEWSDHRKRMERLLQSHYGAGRFTLEDASDPHGFSAALRRYFSGECSAIDQLPVQTNGTPFQRLVWRELRTIPCGATVSYGQLAERIGKPLAVRAVGLANGANPIGIVVPCHRVIGSNGSLTGYGGGIERKRWLLHHEQAAIGGRLFA